ncbi:helix-hairpin-helix domain-containing protein [Romboutsia ilealis]|uniref:helix-hairpin-helix domain-containing protein n=2 Tax=Romboutsia ilealis TaxID=1115758 RepID=UPI00272982E3|nr:helix-hairpin-helix domain-containing protein [Romboutsia ilealis]
MSKKIATYKTLDDIYKKLKSNDFDDTIKTIIEGVSIPRLTKYYTEVAEIQKLDDLDKFTIVKIIEITQYLYNNTDILSPLSDEEYDKLYEVLVDLGLNIVGSVNAQGKPVRNHKYPDLRGSLDKVHFLRIEDKGKDKRKSIEDWIKTMENKLGFRLVGDRAKVKLQPKWDGVSVVFECDGNGIVEHALLRGDTGRNEAVTLDHLFKGVDFSMYCSSGRKFGLKTEVMVSDQQYDELCKIDGSFSSPRSACTSILNSKDIDKSYIKFLTIQSLRLQYEGDSEDEVIVLEQTIFGTNVDKIAYLDNLDDLMIKMNAMKLMCADAGLITDGVVLSCLNDDVISGMGRDNHINKFEVAYKFPPETKKSILLDVEFSMGALGNITPVAKIEPVKMRGNKISSINLGSIDRFETLNIRQGDEVIIKYEIIPYLDKDDTCKPGTGKAYPIPTHCPYCNEKLVEDPLLKCINDNCESRVVGKILNYVNKMRIENISINTIERFYQLGFLRSIEDLYRLENHKNEIVQLDGFGSKSFQKIIDGINNRRDVYDYELMGSIGIQDIGERMFKKILSVYSINDLKSKCEEPGKFMKELINLEGIKDKTADKIIRGIYINTSLINFLLKEVKVKKNTRVYDKKVCFSKIRDKEFEKFLDENNVLVMDSFKKETDILIVPDVNESSSKIDKAKKQGKPVIDLKTAHEYFGYNV